MRISKLHYTNTLSNDAKVISIYFYSVNQESNLKDYMYAKCLYIYFDSIIYIQILLEIQENIIQFQFNGSNFLCN